MIRIILPLLFFFFSTQVLSANYLVEEVEFVSDGDQLSGSLFTPKGDIHAAVTFVHGSGKQTRNRHWAARFTEEGIAALVYDKRGVGRSGGEYEGNQSVSEKNIDLLARDAVAALSVLQNHSKIKELPIGLTGISQAGWIIPIAAERSVDIDFMVIWSGPVCRVSEEDIYSKYTADLDNDRVPAYHEALSSRKRKYVWPDFLGKDTDPSQSLSKLKMPGLWIFGGKDGSVPVDLSIQRLQEQKGFGSQYHYALFSNLGHNNMSETFTLATDWIKTLAE